MNRGNTVPEKEVVALTPREVDVLREVGSGETSAKIGAKLLISKRTVDFHLSNIFHKLQVSNRLKALVVAEKRGLLAIAVTLGIGTLSLLGATSAPARAAVAAHRYRQYRITYYCGGCDPSHRTRSGAPWSGRGVATDPSIIPPGSKVWIAGFGKRPFIADDTGGKINNYHIDVRRQTNHCRCSIKGAKYAQVTFRRPRTAHSRRKRNVNSRGQSK